MQEGAPEVIVSAVNIPVMDQYHLTSSEDKETDDSSSTTSESLHREANLSMTNTKHALPEQVVKESTPKESSLVHMEPQKIEEKQVNLSEIKGTKIPYNQKVEQDLICELLEFITWHDSISLPNSISSKHILDVPVDADPTPGSVPHLAHLFDKAEKTGRKEKLRWYYYSEEYEKKYLRKMTQKAKNIYTLFKGVGIDKIGVVTCSADAISRLTDAQIQNIINLYTDELTKSQKLIGSGSKKPPDVGISTPQTSKTNQTNVRAQSKPTYDRSYFRSKTLDQYPNLYREGSDGNDDYYGITDESLCPLCKLDHDDENGIEGRYEIGYYNLKCEQRGIEIE
ncbi:15749_t:CDS:2, partial [Racocetra fulgida]